MWEAHEHPLPDVDAIAKTIAAIRAGLADNAPDPTDLGAALVVLQAARLDMDRLEAELIGAVREAGLHWAQIAAVLGLSDAAAAEERYAKMPPRLDAPVDQVESPKPSGAGAAHGQRQGDRRPLWEDTEER